MLRPAPGRVQWLLERLYVQVLTFDFHNTLANCGPWFDLEVRDLPWAVIERLELVSAGPEKDRVDQAYRHLRLGVIASGIEIDAYDSVSDLFERLHIPSDPPAVEHAIDALMLEAVEAMEAVPGAIDTVRFLHNAGVRLGVVSSAVHHRTLDWILDRMGIGSCFDAVVTSASSGFYKSSPVIYDTALHELGGDARTSVHVGDSLKWDVTMAQRAGMTAVWLQTPRRDMFAADGDHVPPALTLETMQEAGPVLAGLLERLRIPANA